MKVPSARHRRLVADQERRLLVKEWSFRDKEEREADQPLGVGTLEYDTGDSLADILSMVVEDNVDNYRKALALLASDLLAVYDFIDEWEIRLNRPSGYARAQQVVLRALKLRMESPMTDLLIETIMGERPNAQ